MRRVCYLMLLCCAALAGCEKVPVVEFPGSRPEASKRNTNPVVNAGVDVTVQWPENSVQLGGSATDDGLPGTALSYAWESVPADVTFDDRLAAQTVARFPAPGTYTLKLVVDDGDLRGDDSLIVTVVPLAGGSNAAPVVTAGADQTVELGFAATLTGSVTDDGLPGSPMSVTWSMQSGPGGVSFRDSASAATDAMFTVAGTYELLLSADDGELTGSDTVTVTVTPAVYPAPDLSETDPDRGWQRVAPADVGMDPAGLAAAQAYAEQAGGTGLISRHGRLVHSWGNIDRRYDTKSTTKSIGAIALAMALDEGRVQLRERAATYLPTIGTPPNTNDPGQLQSITLLQLATHTAGFEKTGAYGRLIAAPGTQWHYSDGALNWLADTLTTVYAQDLEQLFMARVWPVLGINERDDIQWRDSTNGMRPGPRPNGIEHREFAAGFVANVNALARVGLLYLRRGEWAGGQRIFADEFADLVRTPQPEVTATTLSDPNEFPDANQRYGLLWWTNATGALPNVPRDAYWAWGLGDSLIVVIPSLDLVIARVGDIQPASPDQRIFGDDDWNGDYSVLAPFLDAIVGGVR